MAYTEMEEIHIDNVSLWQQVKDLYYKQSKMNNVFSSQVTGTIEITR